MGEYSIANEILFGESIHNSLHVDRHDLFLFHLQSCEDLIRFFEKPWLQGELWKFHHEICMTSKWKSTFIFYGTLLNLEAKDETMFSGTSSISSLKEDKACIFTFHFAIEPSTF